MRQPGLAREGGLSVSHLIYAKPVRHRGGDGNARMGTGISSHRASAFPQVFPQEACKIHKGDIVFGGIGFRPGGVVSEDHKIIIAAAEGVFTDGCDALGNQRAAQTGAAGKGSAADLPQLAGKDDLGETGAALEGPGADLLQPAGEIKILHLCHAGEGFLLDLGQGRGQVKHILRRRAEAQTKEKEREEQADEHGTAGEAMGHVKTSFAAQEHCPVFMGANGRAPGAAGCFFALGYPRRGVLLSGNKRGNDDFRYYIIQEI